ncbi:A-kinase anchor protein 13 isoform X4 [Alligator mississippiensis]|uniref:A-kinase anchor protein 13 isoform X4 n=1 Tax=Alligator mississippiensis TaxID=8496 RepID=UPI0009072335|nr:A-kinase anchor protein 13 isoform X4 [Alligator mississippiensis]
MFWVMKLNPQQAPLYGDSVITVLLAEEDKLEDDVDFYLVFTGSAVQHCTSTRKVNPGTLETIAPGHDCCETVKVELCASKEGLPILVVAEDRFQFIQDEAYDAAQFLATCAGNQQALNFTRFLDRSRPPSGDLNFLDEKVALAFRHLKLPAEWNVLGADQTLNENIPRETLLHFSVRLGLQRLTWFLLQQPGGRGALCIRNNEGATPVTLALERGYQKLHQLLTEEDAGEPDSWSTLSHVVHSGDCCVKYHQGLSVYTLTAEAKNGAKAALEDDIERLQKCIKTHQHANAKQQPESEPRTEDNSSKGRQMEGHQAVVTHNSEEMSTEVSKEGPSATADLDLRQFLAPSCHKEDERDSGSLGVLNDMSGDLLSVVSTESRGCSSESQNTATLSKKEEEGPASIVGSEAVSDKNACTLSPAPGINGAASLPSCGNTNEETGMTSTGVILDQTSLVNKDNIHQEVQIAEECATESPVTTVETASKPRTSGEGVDVAMGQSECKNCAGTRDASPVQRHEEHVSAEATGARAASLKEVLPAGEELIHAAEPLLGDVSDAAFEGGVMQVMQAQDTANARTDANILPNGLGETSNEGITDFQAETTMNGFSDAPGQDAPVVKERQSVTAAGEEVQAMSEIKPSENVLKQDVVVLEVNNNSKSSECGVQVDNGSLALELNELELSELPHDGHPNADAERGAFGKPYEIATKSARDHKAGELIAEAEQSLETPVEMLGTETVSSRGTSDTADGGQGAAGNCHAAHQAVEQDKISDSLNPEAAAACKCELDSQLPREAGLVLAGKGPLQSQVLTPESTSELEGVSAEMRPLAYPVFREDAQQGQAISQETGAAVSPSGQEACMHDNDPKLSSCAKDTESIQDNFIGTPSAIHNKESKQNQEVAETAVVAEQGSSEHGMVTTETNLPPDLREEENSACSLLPPAERNSPEPNQELDQSGAFGRESALSKEPGVAVVKSCACNQGEQPEVSDSTADTGLQGEISCQEATENVAADAGESITQESVLEDKSQDAKDDWPSSTALNQECDLSPALQGSCPCAELKEALGLNTFSVACENMELLEEAQRSLVTSYPEDQGDIDNVLSRVSLQPIVEEATCDSDSSSDTVCLASESEAGSEVKEAQEILAELKEDEEEQNKAIFAAPPSLCSESLNAAEPLENVGEKSFVPEGDGFSLDEIIEGVEGPDAVVSLGEAPCSPEPPVKKPEGVPVAEGTETEPQAVVNIGAMLDGEVDLSLPFGDLTKGDINPGVLGSEIVIGAAEMKTEDELDFLKDLRENSFSEGMINRESWCPIEPCSDPSLLESKRTRKSTECEHFLEDGLSGVCTSSQGILKRESGSESEFFSLPGDGMDDIVFGKQPEEEQSACDITSSSSSADDTVSLERNSSLGSDISLPHVLSSNRHKDRHSLDGSCINMANAEGRDSEPAGSGETEEEMDSITEVPAHSSVLRNSMRPLSPFRRHSWGPGKNAANEAEINHRSSMRVLGDGIRKPPIHRRSLSWCPSGVQYIATGADFNFRSYSLEGLAGDSDDIKKPPSNLETSSLSSKDPRRSPLASDEQGSSVLLTEEELEDEHGELRGFDRQIRQRSQPHGFNFCSSAMPSPLTKSISLMTISQPGLDSTRSFSGTSSSLAQSISEESCNFPPNSPSRKDLEWKSGTKVSRTFSYLKNKMSSSKKSKEKEKDKEKIKEKDKDSKEKEKDKKLLNGHLFNTTPVVGPVTCHHCMKPFNKDSYLCANCNAIVHKGCKESLASCAKVKMKPQKGMLQAHDTSSLPAVIMRNKPSQPKERPRSAVLAPDENTVTSLFNNRRSQQSTALSKSVSIQNIAGVGSEESLLNNWKYLSQSTDSLHKISRVNESTESLVDEGTDMNEGQLMGDFELDSKQLEAESWSQVVDSKFLRQQKKDVVKRQDVIYELMQTEMHHVRTLKIMSDVYSRGMMQELQFEQQTVEKVFPCLDDLLNIHNQFFQRILERKKESLADKSEKNFVIKRIGDILVNQFSGENAERMKKTYGKFCGHHNEAVNYFKDLLSKEKRFQAFIKKKMSSAVVRRLGIPECILLVTQRITKYPVLLQRILEYTKENEVEHQHLTQSLNLVKDVIAAVDSKVNNYEKKMRLSEIYTRVDSKSIMRMKSGQMIAKEDLRRRKLIRDGPVSLKNAAGRLKEVQAVLLSDILIFLQEKDQKYIFASLDTKSTVISLKKLIVREVAHEEKGLFLISTGVPNPEMVEVHASSKEERNSWIQLIQDTINTMDKDEDEGVPSESEVEKKELDAKAKELKEQLQQKDQQILTLLEEKGKIFRDMTDCSVQEDGLVSRVLFRANTEEAPKGENIMKSAINEVELLQSMVSRSLGSALGPQVSSPNSEQEEVGPISLPRRAETFGGFDSHQMNASKCGEKDESEDAQDLRRTESDSILKKGGNANFMFMLKRNNEAVVLQQDTYIEDQKMVLNERALTRTFSRPNSLIEQEKQRSLEKQRLELANLQKQQAQYLAEKQKREKEWETREKVLADREMRLTQREEQAQKGHQELEKEKEELQKKKSAYQIDLERLRAAQKQLEREKEQLQREMEQLHHAQLKQAGHNQVSKPHEKTMRTPSLSPAEDPSKQQSSSLPEPGHFDSELSVSPKRNSLSRTSKEKCPSKLHSTTNQTNKAAEGQHQIPSRLFGLGQAKPKDKKEKKKKSKSQRSQPADGHSSEAPLEGKEIFC